MRLAVMPELLRAQLLRCAKVSISDTKSSIKPIYAYVELLAKESMLCLRAQDPHLQFEGRLLAETVEELGNAIVECERLNNVLKCRPDGTPIALWTKDEFLHIKQGEFKAKLPLLRTEEFPEILFDGPYAFEHPLEVGGLKAIPVCANALEDDRSSIFLGVLVDYSEFGVLRVAGCSSTYQQAACFESHHTVQARFVIPPKAIELIASLNPSPNMRICYDDANCRAFILSTDESVGMHCAEDRGYGDIYKSLIGAKYWMDGTFPLVTKVDGTGAPLEVIPRTPFVFNCADFLSAISSAASVLTKGESNLTLAVDKMLADDKGVLFELIGNDLVHKARAVEKIVAAGVADSKIQLRINYPIVRDIIKKLSSDKVEKFALYLGVDPLQKTALQFAIVAHGQKDAAAFVAPTG